ARIGRAATRYRSPVACTAERIASSGRVSRLRLPCIERRGAGDEAQDAETREAAVDSGSATCETRDTARSFHDRLLEGFAPAAPGTVRPPADDYHLSAT